MGKLRRERRKLHIPSKNEKFQEKDNSTSADTAPLLPLTSPKENLFSGLNIDLGSIKNSLLDDTQSVKSYKSLKSVSGQKILPKKEKIKLRRKLLLQKIDGVNQMKKDLKLREKRKNIDLIGDTNPLHDALPSLESLLKNRPTIKYNISTETTSKKGITKANKRKKLFVQDVNIYKQTLKHANFIKNPFDAISSHIKAVVEQEHSIIKNKK